jgi:hypothetical protein
MKARSKAQEEGNCMTNSNYWQLVFNQSRVNGAEYFGDRLPTNSWDWPKNTFLQKRLSELKKRRFDGFIETTEENRKPVSTTNHKRRHTRYEQPIWLRRPESMSSIEEH